MDLQRWDSALECWKKAEAYKNFDFDRMLGFRLKSNHEKLKARKARAEKK